MRFAVLALAFALLCAVPARAQDDREMEVARSAHEISRDLMSPYCPGRTLEACPSPDALVVREEIRAALRAGEAPDSIRARIEARFGQGVVGLPQSSFGRALPVILVIAGGAALIYALRRLVR